MEDTRSKGNTFDVHITNLPMGVTKEMIADAFEDPAALIEIAQAPCLDSRFKYGFLRFKKMEEAISLIQKFNRGVNILGRHISLSLSKSTLSKIEQITGELPKLTSSENVPSAVQQSSPRRVRRRRNRSKGVDCEDRKLVGEQFLMKEGMYRKSPEEEKIVIRKIRESLHRLRNDAHIRELLKIDSFDMLKSFELGIRDVLIKLPSIARGTGFDPFTVEGKLPSPDHIIDIMLIEADEHLAPADRSVSVDFDLTNSDEDLSFINAIKEYKNKLISKPDERNEKLEVLSSLKSHDSNEHTQSILEDKFSSSKEEGLEIVTKESKVTGINENSMQATGSSIRHTNGQDNRSHGLDREAALIEAVETNAMTLTHINDQAIMINDTASMTSNYNNMSTKNNLVKSSADKTNGHSRNVIQYASVDDDDLQTTRPFEFGSSTATNQRMYSHDSSENDIFKDIYDSQIMATIEKEPLIRYFPEPISSSDYEDIYDTSSDESDLSGHRSEVKTKKDLLTDDSTSIMKEEPHYRFNSTTSINCKDESISDQLNNRAIISQTKKDDGSMNSTEAVETNAIETSETFCNNVTSESNEAPLDMKMSMLMSSKRSLHKLMELDLAFERERLELQPEDEDLEQLREDYEQERHEYLLEILAELKKDASETSILSRDI